MNTKKTSLKQTQIFSLCLLVVASALLTGCANIQRHARMAGLKGNALDLQRMINNAKAGDTVIIPEGVCRQGIWIDKPLTLKGKSREKCIFELTANNSAISVATKGKGDVKIENLTVKWQLATSETTPQPNAVEIKDSKVIVKNCAFLPLGNFKRCPVALRTKGFSSVSIQSCRFEGYEYTVQFREGSQGLIEDCLVMDSGHQGVSVYADADVTIQRNVITGSKYHGIRNTGGTAEIKDNLIIANDNRGIYLGNKPASGVISNNVIIDNGTGISGFAWTQVEITNNIIAKSSFAGTDMRDSCRLTIKDNIFSNNQRGLALFKESGSNGNKVLKNTIWQNATDWENMEKPKVFINAEPPFTDPDNGDFSLKPGPMAEQKQGLTDPAIHKSLWKLYQMRSNRNVPLPRPHQ
ncbi:MAG: right-handed parallel beta-helix repeat-containing protein [Planctomycetota bacterium]